jgi:serine/threonine-protein kinase
MWTMHPNARHDAMTEAGRPLRVVVADDSVLIRQGVTRVLSAGGFDVVGDVGTAEELLTLVAGHRPDVAIIDIRMPPEQSDEGLRAARTIRAMAGPRVGVLMLSQYVEPAFAMTLLADGAEGLGYLLKDRVGDLDDFLDAVRRIAHGGSVIDPEVVTRLVNRVQLAGPIDELTERERDVLSLIAEGRSNAAIAGRLFVTEKTVEAHTANIFAKLGLLPTPDDHRRVLAVLAYLRTAGPPA